MVRKLAALFLHPCSPSRHQHWLHLVYGSAEASHLLQIVLWIIGIASACAFAVFLFGLLLFWQPEPPSLAKLAKNFPERRQTLTEILAMSSADTHYSRIDPTFINYGDIDGTPDGQSSWGDANSPLSKDRWNQYRELFSRARLHQGIARDADGNVFFVAGSVGFLDAGHSTGYLFCRAPGLQSSQNSPFEPCTLPTQDFAFHSFQPDARVEAYSFKRVSDHWYVFNQGAS